MDNRNFASKLARLSKNFPRQSLSHTHRQVFSCTVDVNDKRAAGLAYWPDENRCEYYSIPLPADLWSFCSTEVSGEVVAEVRNVVAACRVWANSWRDCKVVIKVGCPDGYFHHHAILDNDLVDVIDGLSTGYQFGYSIEWCVRRSDDDMVLVDYLTKIDDEEPLKKVTEKIRSATQSNVKIYRRTSVKPYLFDLTVPETERRSLDLGILPLLNITGLFVLGLFIGALVAINIHSIWPSWYGGEPQILPPTKPK